MISKKTATLFLCLGLLTSSFSQQKFETLYIKGFTNNKLEVLDWGGKGKPIFFLAGLGNTAHIFENFAPKFINNYHVYGITRRGFGQSDRTLSGFATDTLVQDLLKVMDNLSIKKVILIGHSVAGDELSTFARNYPDRVITNIYLDAALDHLNDSILGKSPQSPAPSLDFKPTLQNLEEDYFKGHGFYIPESEITNSWGKFNKNGLLVDDTTTYYSFSKMNKALKSISYKNIACPSLAIYVDAPTAPERFKAFNLFDSANKLIAEEALPRWTNYYDTEINRFKKECKNCEVVKIRGAHHCIFLSNPNETEIAIRKFLKKL